jgi:thioesterase domain-containing protein
VTTNIPSLLAELRRRDIHIRLDGEKLQCNAPAGALTPELRERLQRDKAALLDYLRHAYDLTRQQRAIVPLQPHGSAPPLFAVGGHNGDVFCFHHLARCLGPDRPFYGLQPPGADGQGEPLQTVEDIAAYFAQQIRIFQPEGPYLLTGFCAGGTVAFELARQLQRAGCAVAFLGLIASPHPYELRRLARARRYLKERWGRAWEHAAALWRAWPEQRRYLSQALSQHRVHRMEQAHREEDPVLAQGARVQRATLKALARFRPASYSGMVHLFLPGREWMESGGLAASWPRWAPRLEEHYGPAGCSSEDMLQEVHAPSFAEIFRRCLEGEGSWGRMPLESGEPLQEQRIVA